MTVKLELTVRYCTWHNMSASHLHRSRRNKVGIHAGGTPISRAASCVVIFRLRTCRRQCTICSWLAISLILVQSDNFTLCRTFQSCPFGSRNCRRKSRSVQRSKPIRHVASVASLLHRQVPGEKRQDFRLNPLGNLVGVVAFVSLESVHDSEIGHHLFELFIQAG